MFAVVRTGGKQYRVEEGRAVRIDRIAGEPGDTVELGDVLLMGEGESVTMGAPAIDGARVVGTIAEQGRARKIVVFRYKAKTRSRKKTGHRQQYTAVMVSDILAAGQEPKPKKPAETEAAADEEAPKRRRRGKPAAAATAEAPDPAAETEAVAEATEAEATAQPEAAPEPESAAEPKPKRTRKKAE